MDFVDIVGIFSLTVCSVVLFGTWCGKPENRKKFKEQLDQARAKRQALEQEYAELKK